MSWNRGRWWYQLAQVCQRWRNLILGSSSYLRISLVCTNGTPVANMLAHSPLALLPLTVDYVGQDGISAEDEEGILLALEQRHRVRHIRLLFPVQNLQNLVMAIDDEFPILEYMIIEHRHDNLDNDNNLNDTVLMLPETLQAPDLHHLALNGFACPMRSPLHPTAVGLVTLSLVITCLSAYFQPNVLLQWVSFMPQLERLDIQFTFPVPNRDVERQLTHMLITTHVTLPNLRMFCFRGVSAYLEAVVCRITTPRLEILQIQFFEQLTFRLPRLLQFMNMLENFGFDNAAIEFGDKVIDVLMFFSRADKQAWHAFGVRVDCWHLDWQVSSMAQISNALRQVFSAVEYLLLRPLRHNVHDQSSEEHNNVGRIEWRKLLRSFSNVKTLRVEDGLVEELSRCLRLEDGELPLELLPELHELIYYGSRDAGDSFSSFIEARENAGRPVTLDHRSPRPRSPESSSDEDESAITSASGEAGNDADA